MANWFLLSITAAVLLATLILIVKRGLNEGISSWAWMMYYYAFAAIMIAVYLYFTKVSMLVSGTLYGLLVIAAILGTVGNVASTEAVKLSPNPGYVSAVTSTQIILVALASILIFQSEFTLIKGAGTLLVVAGVIILGW